MPQPLLADQSDQLTYIPFVSREDTDFTLSGRIPQAIEDGRLEDRAGCTQTAHKPCCAATPPW